MTVIDIVCLGVGKGASYVLKGKPSTGFVIRVNSRPRFLVDCGAGIALSYQRHIGSELPNTIYISHNHMDHTGDLPIVLGVTPARPQVLGHPDVIDIVKQHRLHDSEALNASLTQRAHWVIPDNKGVITLEDDLSLHLFRSVHSYLCYGFILRKGNQDILGYPADSAFDEAIFKRVTHSPVAILDAREEGNFDHASFEDIEQFSQSVPQCSIWVVHYEETNYRFTAPNVRLMREGDVVQLFEG